MTSLTPVAAYALAALLLFGADDEKDAPAEVVTTVEVTDRQGKKTILSDPVCVYKTKSLFGEGEEKATHLVVNHGKGTIKVRFTRIQKLVVTKIAGDTVHLTLQFPGDKDPSKFEASSEIRIRGESKFGEYEIEMPEVKELVFTHTEKKPTPESTGKREK